MIGPPDGPLGRVRRWSSSTPGRLRLLVACSWVVTMVLGAIVTSSAGEHRRAAHAIGVDAAPSVEAAHNIKLEIESLDADLVNEMLVDGAEEGEWAQDFAKNRIEIGRHLLDAVRSAFGEHEHASIERLADGLGEYLMAAQQALDSHHRKEGERAIAAYRASAKLLETVLVPAAIELDRISDVDLEAVYEAQLEHSHEVRVLVVVVAIVLVALLAAMQLYVLRRFRRRVSPGLALAALLVVGFAGYSVREFQINAHDLEGLKVYAYDSVDVLLDARATAYAAKATQSRWLLDHSQADQQRFRQLTHELINLSPEASVEVQALLLRQAAQLKQHANGDARGVWRSMRKPYVGGIEPRSMIAIAIDNVSFVEQVPVAAEAVAAFGAFLATDLRVRELATAGKQAEAVAFALGGQPGRGQHAFLAFDAALDRWLAIDQAHLESYTEAAQDSVANLPLVAPLLTLLIMTAIALGLRPRIKEYAR